jgi:hypothetical protein
MFVYGPHGCDQMEMYAGSLSDDNIKVRTVGCEIPEWIPLPRNLGIDGFMSAR